jgi:hypothetical protein
MCSALRPRRLLPLLALAALAACGSTGGARPDAKGKPASIVFHDYRSGASLTLVNESHTNRLEQYSKSVRPADATTKVASDEIVDALIQHMASLGFFAKAASGPAPDTSQEWTQALEVDAPGGARHMLAQKGIDAGTAKTFREARDAFLEVYNNVFQAQSVEAQPDQQLFKQHGNR